jgi:Na+/H+ antiporter NhaC
VVFVVAALVSFATGTSWGTMAILFPLVMPLAHELAPGDHLIMLSAVSSILTGSVWGDHCSPISDTTILSSMASSCDHVDHVRTQLPYALAVGLVSLVFGDLATGLGLYPAWVGMLLGAAALVLLLRVVGRVVPDHVPAD